LQRMTIRAASQSCQRKRLQVKSPGTNRGGAPMEILPLGPGFAAELRGIALSDVTVDDAVYAAVRAAFEDHSVLVFRGQDVTDEGQLAFSQRFGAPEITKVGSASAGTYFAVLTTIGEDGK